MLVLLCAQASGGIREDHHVLAAVVEMIHTATLVHDDVLDEAATRRHVATVNSRWNNETSVLCGDYLLSHAFHLAATLESTLACRVIGLATNRVCEGEMAQIHERGNLDLDEATYFRIIEGKTAELCAVSSFLGAHFSGVDAKTSESLREYGRCLGIAFQIADDILDVIGEESIVGKSLGSDFVKQKLTLPVIWLLNNSDASLATHARELVASANPTACGELRELLVERGAVHASRETASRMVTRARQALTCLEDSPAQRILEELTEFAGNRAY